MRKPLHPDVLNRFERLFAPQLSIHVFRDIEGYAFSSVRIPRSHQVIVGMSIDLFHHVADHIFEQTGRQIEKDFDVKDVRGPREPISIPQPIDPVTVSEFPSPIAPRLDVLWLVPEAI